jgi:hypothetical protein
MPGPTETANKRPGPTDTANRRPGPTDTNTKRPSADTGSKDVAHRLLGEVHQRLEWYERVLEVALGYFAVLNGSGLVVTVAFTGFLIQYRRPAALALPPALLFAAGLVVIALFHLGHAVVVRNWARGKFRIHRDDDDQFSFSDDQGIIARLFSHLHLWPVVAAGLCGVAGLISGLELLYRE